MIIFFTFIFLTSTPFAGKDNPSTTYTNKQEKTSTAWTASWSHNDSFVAIGNDNGELTIYETKQWEKVKSWTYKATTITRLEWNPKHPVLAVAAVWHEGTPSAIQLFDMAKDQILRTLPDSLQGRGVSWSPNGEDVAYVGAKGRVSLFTKKWRTPKDTIIYQPPFSV
jgi:WD40 repeat protein